MQPTAISPVLSGHVLADRLNVRDGPSTEFNVIGKLFKGNEVTGAGRNPTGDWMKVHYAGHSGWVSARYIDFQSPVSDLPVISDTGRPPQPPQPEEHSELAVGQAATTQPGSASDLWTSAAGGKRV
jgi:uncharacterized protein YgiM (DUF1202 family)